MKRKYRIAFTRKRMLRFISGTSYGEYLATTTYESSPNMKTISLSAIALVLLLSSFGGCSNTEPIVNAPSLCGSVVDMKAKTMGIQGKWLLMAHGTSTMNLADCKPEAVSEISMEFNGEGGMTATSSCNSATGNYAAAGGELQFSGLGFTEMMCGDAEGLEMVWERKFQKGLESVTGYEIIGNVLHLKTNSGSDLYLLKAG